MNLATGKDNLGNQRFEGWNNLNNFNAGSAGDYRVYAKIESNGQSKEASYEFKVG